MSKDYEREKATKERVEHNLKIEKMIEKKKADRQVIKEQFINKLINEFYINGGLEECSKNYLNDLLNNLIPTGNSLFYTLEYIEEGLVRSDTNTIWIIADEVFINLAIEFKYPGWNDGLHIIKNLQVDIIPTKSFRCVQYNNSMTNMFDVTLKFNKEKFCSSFNIKDFNKVCKFVNILNGY